MTDNSTIDNTSASQKTADERQLFRCRCLLLLAAVMWSISGLIVKHPALESIPAQHRGILLACYRALFAAVCMLPLISFRKIGFHPVMLLMVIAFSLMNVLFVSSLTRTTAAAAIFLQYTSSVWAFLFGYVFLKEKVDTGNLVALLFAVVGIVFIVAGDWSGDNFVGNMLALCSGFTLAGVYLCLRHLRQHDSAWLVFLNHLVAGIVLLPFVVGLPVQLTATHWCLAAVLGCVQMGIPYVLFTRAVRGVRIQEASLLTLLEPILNPIWVWLVWSEAVSSKTIIGGCLILSGLAIRYLCFPDGARSSAKTQDQPQPQNA